jgi:hypothetical protein
MALSKVFYRILIAGQAGSGAGVLVFDDSGSVVGADAGGVTYDGSFRIEQGQLRADVVVTVPSGLALVTGTPPSGQPLGFTVKLSIPLDDLTTELDIPTPVGQVRVQLRRLRISI